MRSPLKVLGIFLAVSGALLLLHLPLLRLPYFWDEAGYYIPSALDFYRSWTLIPHTTLPEGHPPLVMIYIGLAWRLFGFSPLIARIAMTLMGAGTVTALYVLARRIANAEIAIWSAILLALSPLFFAQTTLVHLDLAAALFTTLAVTFLLARRPWLFALAVSLAVLSKETAVILLPVAWVCALRNPKLFPGNGNIARASWAALALPLIPLAAWTLYYHHATGFWTGNLGYLSYNLYSTLSPVRVFWSLTRRIYELFISGFQWVLTLSVPLGIWWGRKFLPMEPERLVEGPPWRPFIFLTAGIAAVTLRAVIDLENPAIEAQMHRGAKRVFYFQHDGQPVVTKLSRNRRMKQDCLRGDLSSADKFRQRARVWVKKSTPVKIFFPA